METKVIADRVYKWFFKGDFLVRDEVKEDIIEIDDIELENMEK